MATIQTPIIEEAVGLASTLYRLHERLEAVTEKHDHFIKPEYQSEGGTLGNGDPVDGGPLTAGEVKALFTMLAQLKLFLEGGTTTPGPYKTYCMIADAHSELSGKLESGV